MSRVIVVQARKIQEEHLTTYQKLMQLFAQQYVHLNVLQK